MKKSSLWLFILIFIANSDGFAKSVIHDNRTQNKNNNKKSIRNSFVYKPSSKGVSFDQEECIEENNVYLPYVEFSGAKFFNLHKSSWATGVDLFMPLWQANDLSHLIFTHARFFDRTAKPFEGNLHLGYRYLSEDKHRLHGVYGAYDRSHTYHDNYFSQLAFGVENWFDQLFIGANYYLPIGKRSKFTGLDESPYNIVGGKYFLSNKFRAEQVAYGFDVTVGYEFIPGLIGYIGGYYFNPCNLKALHGSQAKVNYDYSLVNGKKIWGFVDKLGLEAGIKNDSRGTIGYVGVNLRIGLLPKQNKLEGVARHMVDLVHRDVDIVTIEGVIGYSDGIIEAVSINDEEVLSSSSGKTYSKNYGHR